MTFASHNDDESKEIKTTKQKQINNKHNLNKPQTVSMTHFSRTFAQYIM